MILSIGEILADFIGEDETKFRMCCGGAPFNVAVNAKHAGAKVGFIGRVGKDPVGNYLPPKQIWIYAKFRRMRFVILHLPL